MREKNRRRLLLGVAAIHLTLVAIGTSEMSLEPLGPLGQLLDEYGLLSGTANSYGFFAGEMLGQFGVNFDVIDGEGRKTTTALETDSSHEGDLRIGHIIGEFSEDDQPGLHRSFAASLAGKIFARYPQARKVTVRLEYFNTVSMDDFRRGARPRWWPRHETTFVYQGQRTGESVHGTGAR